MLPMKTYDNVSDAGEIKSLSEQRVRPCRCVLPTGLCKENSKEGGCLAKQERGSSKTREPGIAN